MVHEYACVPTHDIPSRTSIIVDCRGAAGPRPCRSHFFEFVNVNLCTVLSTPTRPTYRVSYFSMHTGLVSLFGRCMAQVSFFPTGRRSVSFLAGKTRFVTTSNGARPTRKARRIATACHDKSAVLCNQQCNAFIALQRSSLRSLSLSLSLSPTARMIVYSPILSRHYSDFRTSECGLAYLLRPTSRHNTECDTWCISVFIEVDDFEMWRNTETYSVG